MKTKEQKKIILLPTPNGDKSYFYKLFKE